MLTAAKTLRQKPQSWLLYFGRQFIGTPYVGGVLDRAKEEKIVVDLDELDCTTFVEQALALAICAENGKNGFCDFLEALRHVRYIGGDIAYTSRQHYFTVWLDDNISEGLIDNIAPNPPFTAVQTVNINYMTTHTSSYKMLTAHPLWQPGIRAMEQKYTGRTYRYIPKGELANSRIYRKTIHDGDIIGIVTNKKGLDIAHLGIAVWRKDGLYMLNASSISHKVEITPTTFKTYLMKHPSHLGFRISRQKIKR